MQNNLFSTCSEQYSGTLYLNLRKELKNNNAFVVVIFKERYEIQLRTNYKFTVKEANDIKKLAYHFFEGGKPISGLNESINNALQNDEKLVCGALKAKTAQLNKTLIYVISEANLLNACLQIAQLVNKNLTLTLNQNGIDLLKNERDEAKLFAKKYATLSHEFKTPLNVILTSVQLLKMKLKLVDEKTFNQDYRKLCAYIEENFYGLSRLVSNLLDAAKLGIENVSLDLKFVDFEQSARLCAEQLTEFALTYGITIEIVSQLQEKRFALIDLQKFDKILLNLISNAISSIYNCKRENGKITINVSQTNEHYILTVRDNGDGIDAEAMPHIFDIFYSKQSGAGLGGTGIGLALVKNLVELHQGTVQAVNDNGAVFTCTFSKVNSNLCQDAFYSNTAEYFTNSENVEARQVKAYLAALLKIMND